ncbi:hypothetical protein OOU_Y34scaffold00728g4 [Pyricularia oryzae Y34]|uniref:Uncharacterized protein n=2 Tax=Pyricularia oryzae TaxID=318829 RepID=A0AA97NRL3_PYRO3|nr:hypothetical protein OOU_Y34scaffold00728g4 [Pyricularia oryzae Y34]
MHPLSISRRRPDKRPYQHARAPEDADSSRMGYDTKENALQYYEAVECQLLAQVVFLQVITLMAVLAAEQRWGLSMDMCRYWAGVQDAHLMACEMQKHDAHETDRFGD